MIILKFQVEVSLAKWSYLGWFWVGVGFVGDALSVFDPHTDKEEPADARKMNQTVEEETEVILPRSTILHLTKEQGIREDFNRFLEGSNRTKDMVKLGKSSKPPIFKPITQNLCDKFSATVAKKPKIKTKLDDVYDEVE
uniref:Uncharacterized protein n=1 Tax=Cannabis sativa TaxID=3483 RepID=A0A803QAE9_CANSA